MDVIREELLEGEDDLRDFRLEMYKLNVYGLFHSFHVLVSVLAETGLLR